MQELDEQEAKMAGFMPSGIEVNGKGETSLIVESFGDPKAIHEAVDTMNTVFGEGTVTPVDKPAGLSWSGFGNGQMDATQGRRMKQVYKRGRGWVSSN